MGLVKCRSCGVANADSQARCHCCSAALPTQTRQDGARAVHLDDPATLAAHQATRVREGRIASHAIQGAAWLLVVRGTLIPILIGWLESIRKAPLSAQDSPFGNVDPWSMQVISYTAAALFLGLCFWARRNPLPAAIAALLIYAGISTPDLIDGQGLIGKGIIGKLVMASVLARALAAGIVHTVTPAPAPLPANELA